ncbi:hypothetical protein N9937_00620 [bacterium]|nr:hypothetical protein [bacterium]
MPKPELESTFSASSDYEPIISAIREKRKLLQEVAPQFDKHDLMTVASGQMINIAKEAYSLAFAQAYEFMKAGGDVERLKQIAIRAPEEAEKPKKKPRKRRKK